MSVPVALALFSWLIVGRNRPSQMSVLTRVVLPACAVLAIAVIAMGYYNHRVTGDPLRMPYMVHEDTYGVAPLFLWGSLSPAPDYRHLSIRDAHGYTATVFNRQRSLSLPELAATKTVVAMSVTQKMFSPVLLLPLLAIPRALRERHMKWVGLAVAGNYLAVSVATWSDASHYYAPALAAIWLLIVQGLRHVHLVTVGGHRFGRYLVVGLLVLQIGVFASVSHAYVSGQLHYVAEPLQQLAYARQRIVQDLSSRPGKHLVMIRHDPDREVFFSWPANHADIDSAGVVWAHSMDTDENRRLFDYFRDRHVWWLYHDGQDWQVSASSHLATPAGLSVKSKRFLIPTWEPVR